MNELEARAVLGISATASLADARKAQRDLAKVFHPDRHAGASPEDVRRANDAMARINQAFDTLQQLDAAGRLGMPDSFESEWVRSAPGFARRPARTGECFMCGYGPAEPAIFRAYAGFMFWLNSQKFKGSFCRSCGHMLFCETQSINLVRGWWGIVIFPMLFSAVANVANWLHLRKLALPSTRDEAVVSPLPFPAPRVRPVIARPTVWLASGFAGFLILSWMAAAFAPPTSQPPVTQLADIPLPPAPDAEDAVASILDRQKFDVGSCWSAPDASGAIEPVGCASPIASLEVSAVVRSNSECPVDSVGSVNTDDGQVACLRAIR